MYAGLDRVNMKIEETILISSPASKVFHFLSNFRSHKKFFEIFTDSKQVTKGKLGEGTELFSKQVFLGRKIETSSKVTNFVPDKRFTYESVSGPIPTSMDFVLESQGDKATRLTVQYELEPGSFFNLDEIFLRPRVASVVSRSLNNLKSLLEVNN